MNCPPDLADAILAIIQVGVLRARAAGWEGDARRAAAEADHVHNLPDLLREYSDERLRYYWQVERPAFLNRARGADTGVLDQAWNVLRARLEPNPLAAS